MRRHARVLIDLNIIMFVKMRLVRRPGRQPDPRPMPPPRVRRYSGRMFAKTILSALSAAVLVGFYFFLAG